MNYKEIFTKFSIDPSRYEPISMLGGYAPKLVYIFNNKINHIKINVKNNLDVVEKFPNYKRGNSNTWGYILNCLYFFGVINFKKYEEAFSNQGFDLKPVTKYKTLESYLSSEDAFDNIMKNFETGNFQEKEWFRKRIYTMFWLKLEGKIDGARKTYKNTKRMLSRYKGMYEMFSMIFSTDKFEFTSKNIDEIKIIKDNRDSSAKRLFNVAKNVLDSKMENVIYDYMMDMPNIIDGIHEGEVKEITIKLRKRNKKLRDLKLFSAKEIKCEVCGLNMELMYKDYAVPHVHHKKPLAKYNGIENTRLESLAILCPSCHNAIHKQWQNPMSIEQLIKLINNDHH